MSSQAKRPSLKNLFTIDDRDSCERAIRNGGNAAMFSAAITAILAAIGGFVDVADPTLALYMDPYAFADAALLFALGFFVYRRSRVASLSLLVYFTMAKVSTWSQLGAPRGLVVSVLFFAIYMTAVRATGIWHVKYRVDSSAPA